MNKSKKIFLMKIVSKFLQCILITCIVFIMAIGFSFNLPKKVSADVFNGGTILPNGSYRIKNVYSKEYLDVAGAGTSDGTNVDQYSGNDTNAQIWDLTYLGNYHYKITPHTNYSQCLDVAGAVDQDGTNIQVYSSNNTSAQQWSIYPVNNGAYIISPMMAAKVMDVEGPSMNDGANVHLWSYLGLDNQKWIFEQQYYYNNDPNSYPNNGFNPFSAAQYADTYAYNYNSNYLTTPNSEDCTNFVSQSLHAGGLPYINNGNRTDNVSWYYDVLYTAGPIYYASYTWGGAANFARHWGTIKGTGLQNAYKTIEFDSAAAALNDWHYLWWNLYDGDVVQLVDRNAEEAHHSMIIDNYVATNQAYNINDVTFAEHSHNNSGKSLYQTLQDMVATDDNDKIIIHRIR